LCNHRTGTNDAGGGTGAIPRGCGGGQKETTCVELLRPMAIEPRPRRYRNWYSKLLRLYPKAYRERFGEGMEQTFNDLCHERVKAGRGLFSLALWVFVETLAAIIRENAIIVMRCIMNRGSTIFFTLVFSLIAIAALAVCVFPLPRMIAQEAAKTPDTAWQIYLFLVGAYIQAALF